MGCITPWLKVDGVAEMKERAHIPPPEEIEGNDHDKVIADYEREASESSIKSDMQEEKVDSKAEYAAMELF